jgi:hypothetical protein
MSDFRKRLEAMPRLIPVATALAPAAPAGPPKAEPGSRTQAILEQSLHRLAGTGAAFDNPPALTNRARRLLIDAHGVVERLRALADDPLLAGPDGPADAADLLVVHYRETAALTEAAVRYALTFPDAADEQRRLCEGLEGIVDAARRRFARLVAILEQRRTEVSRLDLLARFLTRLNEGDGPIDPGPVEELAADLLADEPGKPLRFAVAEPTATRLFLGGPEYPAPAWFIAAHGLNCAKVMARLVRNDTRWRDRTVEMVLAALLHDVGMLRVDPAVLAQADPLNADQRIAVEAHTRVGSEVVAVRLPTLAGLAEAAASHHERLDGSGYPAGLRGEQLSPAVRLLAVVDAYARLCAPRSHRPPLDPRTALTDTLLMAERGKLDRYAAETLLTLGFYPAGTVVELDDGSTGVVLGSRHAPPLAAQPTVAVLADPGGRPLPAPAYVDLAQRDGPAVVRSLGYPDRFRRLGRAYPEWV